jgi:U3 small nucleolar RNA-associated protein 14
MRALMFYEEQKRHRINKIKSKKYRKIQKRKREREKDAEEEGARLDGKLITMSFTCVPVSSLSHPMNLHIKDPNLDREKMEKEEMDRMKERMTLAHKNTSKWARRVLRRGAKMEPDERRALSLQIAKGDELRRKVMGEESGDDGSHDEDETEEGLLRKARDILVEKCGITEDSLGKRKGLFELDFMKRGMEAQRTRAKEEARRLLEELEANEAVLSTDSEDDSDQETHVKKVTKPKVSSEEAISKVLSDGKLVVTSLEFGKSDGFRVNSLESIDNNKIIEDNKNVAIDEDEPSKKKRKDNKRKKGQVTDEAESGEEKIEQEQNPWLSISNKEMKKMKSSSTKVDINVAASMLLDAPNKREHEKGSNVVVEAEKMPGDMGLASLSQAELVKRAFASPDDLEAEKEFQEEKVRDIML